MDVRPLGATGTLVSELCLGAMNFGNAAFGVGEAESRRVIDAYLDRGGNFVDTADAYSGGASEEIVGRALRDGGRRERVVIATKAFFPVTASFGEPPAHANALGSSRRHLIEACDASLRRLQTDFIDLYQVHCWDSRTPVQETLSTLDGLVKSGKVRHVGLSNWSAWQIAESRMLCRQFGWEPFVTAQMQYSLICRDIEQDVVPACQRYGIGILPWSPLGQGVLTGKYAGGARAEGARFGGEAPTEAAKAWRARFLNERSERVVSAVAKVAESRDVTPIAVSLAWLLARPAVSSVIIGPKTEGQLGQNLAACGVALEGADVRALDEASAPPARYPESFIASTARNAPRPVQS